MTTPEPAALARELAAKLTDEVNSDAVQEFLEAKGVDYDHTDVDEITHLIEQDPVCCRCDRAKCAADEMGDHCAEQACGWCLEGCPAPVGVPCCREETA